MASTSWNSPFRMSKAEKDHLNANKQKKKDLESRLDQLEFDINVIKSVVLNLAGETNKDPLEYLDEAAKQTSCDNVVQHHNDMFANELSRIKKELQEESGMIEIQLSVSEMNKYGDINNDVVCDRFQISKFSIENDLFLSASVSYNSRDIKSDWSILAIEDEADLTSYDKFKIAIYGVEAITADIDDKPWTAELATWVIDDCSGQNKLRKMHFDITVRKREDNSHIFYGTVWIFGENKKLLRTVSIPTYRINRNTHIEWKKNKILYPYIKMEEER